MQDTAYWDCITSADGLNPWAADVRYDITRAARRRDWDALLSLLETRAKRDWINAVHLDDPTLDAPLHEVARGDAPEQVIQKMIDLKAFRTMRNAQGQRPIDLAQTAGHTHLYSILEPTLRADVTLEDLRPIQRHFHELIHERVLNLKRAEYRSLRLPELEPLLESNIESIWCTIPGMYGGFTYWLDQGRDTVTVMTFSHIRIVGNSEKRHVIDANGFRLAEPN